MSSPLRFVVDGKPVRLLPSRFLTPGTDAITFPSVVLIRPDALYDAALLVHESVHVRQWRNDGVLTFLTRYLADYILGRFRGQTHRQSYLAIRYEVQARSAVSMFDAAD